LLAAAVPNVVRREAILNACSEANGPRALPYGW